MRSAVHYVVVFVVVAVGETPAADNSPSLKRNDTQFCDLLKKLNVFIKSRRA